MKPYPIVNICGDELDLGEEVFFCMYPEHDDETPHEALFPHFAIQWDSQGNHRTHYLP